MQEVGGKVPPTCRSWVLCVGKTRRFFGQKTAPKSHETHRRSWWNSCCGLMLWGFDVVENSFKNCHNSVWIMMSCWNPNRWFFFSLQDPLNHSMQQHPKKKSVLPKLRETYFFWSIFVPRKVHRATRRRIPDTAWQEWQSAFPPLQETNISHP